MWIADVRRDSVVRVADVRRDSVVRVADVRRDSVVTLILVDSMRLFVG